MDGGLGSKNGERSEAGSKKSTHEPERARACALARRVERVRQEAKGSGGAMLGAGWEEGVGVVFVGVTSALEKARRCAENGS